MAWSHTCEFSEMSSDIGVLADTMLHLESLMSA